MTLKIPAATLVVFRRNEGRTELLFVERAGTMNFAAGAIVFPGGRVDAGDRMLAERFPDIEPDEAAARIAAIRETVEEAGTAIAIKGTLDAETIARLRAHLHDGVVFSDALAALQLEIEPGILVPFARWCPNDPERRTFDTRFYLAEASPNAATATVDETENVRLFWATAQEVIDAADAGRVKIIFPTRRNLERLAQYTDFAEARADADRFGAGLIVPWAETRDGVLHLCIASDQGYPVTSEPLESAMRG
jgi:8-oxo-dGTP pyrophosphatase MutT (NUDIX family)